MPLCATDGALIDLSKFEDAIEVASDRRTVWAPAGWSLKRLTHALWELGFSLANQGDVNPQSLAGAISTGTHGTGAELGSLATMARAFRLLLADGSIVECSAEDNPQLFQAQRLSLGLLGIALRIRIDVLPAYRLEEKIRRVPFAALLEEFDALAATHRHAEFFVFPYAQDAIVKTLHPTDDTGAFRPEDVREQKTFERCCEFMSSVPFMVGPTQRLMMTQVRASRRVGPAHQIFPSERTVRFEEMEYELPRAVGLQVLAEVIAWIRKRKLLVAFPFEFRWTAADDIWLSPFNRGPAASISIHQYAPMSWQAIFNDAEAIFRAHGGRPHWAKRHTLSAEEVFELYPLAQRFCAVRAEVDPRAKFANAHLQQLFAID